MPISARKTVPKAWSAPSGDLTQTLSVDDVSALYNGEWVLMKVTGLDEQHHITHGQVLHHSPSRKEISRYVRRSRRQDPHAHLYIFPGGTRTVSGEQLREMLAKAAKEDYMNARW